MSKLWSDVINSVYINNIQAHYVNRRWAARQPPGAWSASTNLMVAILAAIRNYEQSTGQCHKRTEELRKQAARAARKQR